MKLSTLIRRILRKGFRKGQMMAREAAGYGLIGAGGMIAATSFLPTSMDPIHGVPAAGTLMGGAAVAGAGAVLTLIPNK